MLAWLIHNRPGNQPNFVWEIDNLDEAPEHLRDLADHARRFSIVIHGAALMYNLLLARRRGDEELVNEYVDRLDRWENELLIPSRALEGMEPRGLVGNHSAEEPAPAPAHDPVRQSLDRPARRRYLDR